MSARPTVTTKIYGVVFLLLGCLLLFLGVRLFSSSREFYKQTVSPAFDKVMSESYKSLQEGMPQSLARLGTLEKQNRYKDLVREFEGGWPKFKSLYFRKYDRVDKATLIVWLLACFVFISTALEIFLRKEIKYSKIYMALIMLAVVYVQAQSIYLTLTGAMCYHCDFGYQADKLFAITPSAFRSCTSENYVKVWLTSRENLILHGVVFLLIYIFSSFAKEINVIHVRFKATRINYPAKHSVFIWVQRHFRGQTCLFTTYTM
jgi:hypothetical protein